MCQHVKSIVPSHCNTQHKLKQEKLRHKLNLNINRNHSSSVHSQQLLPMKQPTTTRHTAVSTLLFSETSSTKCRQLQRSYQIVPAVSYRETSAHPHLPDTDVNKARTGRLIQLCKVIRSLLRVCQTQNILLTVRQGVPEQRSPACKAEGGDAVVVACEADVSRRSHLANALWSLSIQSP